MAGEATLLLAVVGSILAGCDNRTDYEKGLDAINERYRAEMVRLAQESIAEADANERAWRQSIGPAKQGLAVCKAGIGSVMGQRPASMTGRQLDTSRFQVSYTREDGVRWTYRCVVTISRVRWATYENGAEGPLHAEDNLRYTATARELRLVSAGMNGKDQISRYALPSLRPIHG